MESRPVAGDLEAEPAGPVIDRRRQGGLDDGVLVDVRLQT
jgi:hypothetical protein